MDEAELFQAYSQKGEKPKQQVVRDAAMGVAISKCLLYRMMGDRKEGKWRWYHPFTCRFCKYDFAFLDAIHNEYMTWSMWKFGDLDPDDHPTNVANYMALPPEEQERLTAIAQGYVLDEDDKPIGGFSEKLEGQQRPRARRTHVQEEKDPPTFPVGFGPGAPAEKPTGSTGSDRGEHEEHHRGPASDRS